MPSILRNVFLETDLLLRVFIESPKVVLAKCFWNCLETQIALTKWTKCSSLKRVSHCKIVIGTRYVEVYCIITTSNDNYKPCNCLPIVPIVLEDAMFQRTFLNLKLLYQISCKNQPILRLQGQRFFIARSSFFNAKVPIILENLYSIFGCRK